MAQASAIDLFTWQIGSRVPPKVCLCCGRAISAERERKGPYKGPYIWVCSECWANPFLFFPDKTSMFANATLIRGLGPLPEAVTIPEDEAAKQLGFDDLCESGYWMV